MKQTPNRFASLFVGSFGFLFSSCLGPDSWGRQDAAFFFFMGGGGGGGEGVGRGRGVLVLAEYMPVFLFVCNITFIMTEGGKKGQAGEVIRDRKTKDMKSKEKEKTGR